MNKDVTNKIAKHIKDIMKLLEIGETDSNRDTPTRISKMLVSELFKNRNNNNIEELNDKMKAFNASGLATNGTLSPVSIKVPFASMCEHHWLPFYGMVTVVYLPGDKIIGLSKIARVVNFFSKKPQLQERLTKEIGEYLNNYIHPQSLSVKIEAEHMCVSMRGASTPCTTVTMWESN